MTSILTLVFSTLLLPVKADNLACSDSGLDWYTKTAGETPCSTYQRVRQICNPNFQVGAMNAKLPPDVCMDQVADCCCNSVVFALSMLCLSCQRGIGSSGIGYDAAKGTYQSYLQGSRSAGSFCSPNVNKTLPSNVQSAVCNEGIKIFDDLYSRLWWDLGDWYYVYSSETISEDISAKNGNVFTNCPSTTSTSSTSTSASSTPPASTQAQTDTSPTSAAAGTTGDSSSPSTVANDPKSSGSDSTSTAAGGSSVGSHSSSTSAATNGSLPVSVVIASSGATPTALSPNTGNGSSTGTEQTLTSSSHHLSGGAMGGIVVGAVAGAILGVLLLWFLCRRARTQSTGPVAEPVDPFQSNYLVAPFPEAREVSETAGTSTTTFAPLRRSEKLDHIRNRSQSYGFANEVPPASTTRSPTSSGASEVTNSLLNEPMRHTDAGPVPVQMTDRRFSGSLPPAYGEQIS